MKAGNQWQLIRPQTSLWDNKGNCSLEYAHFVYLHSGNWALGTKLNVVLFAVIDAKWRERR